MESSKTTALKAGDRVLRNPRYDWCLCGRHSRCWCRQGAFTVTGARLAVSQSGLMIDIEKDGQRLEGLDSSYFLKKEA